MNSETVITAYVGAYPGGRPAPDLSQVPVSTDDNFIFTFALAFARDTNRDGVFEPVWDPAITPDFIATLQQENPNRRFIASLGGGDNFPWQPPSDEAAWIDNAVSSLFAMQNTYHLEGFDINYENNLDDSFVRVMTTFIRLMNDSPNWPPRFQTTFSVTPFAQTLSAYLQIYQTNHTWVHLFNYQAYADTPSVDGYLNTYAQLAQANLDQEFNGYAELGLGIASSTSAPRGLQPPDIFTVWDNLHSQGVSNAFIWCLEDSAETNYSIESELQRRS
ncbi:MAG TPA: glycosyl hydrolase family 18 protein [Ktedonobacteraceae bacterium]